MFEISNQSTPQTIGDIIAQKDRANAMMQEIRSRMLVPTAEKSPPTFSVSQIASITGLDIGQVKYKITKKEMPGGVLVGSRRTFSLSEAQLWSKTFRQEHLRPKGAEAIVITLANSKGGVTKTTTSMVLGQALSIRGHRVLMIDTDPQSSLTTCFGLLPSVDVNISQTILPVLAGAEDSIRPAIRTTYWENMDLVCACAKISEAEFDLPVRQMDEEDFRFWDALNMGIDDVRKDYDVIIIDSAPAMSYATLNAIMAADGVIIPLPISAIDVAASSEFWTLLGDLGERLQAGAGLYKEFDFIKILLAKVDYTDSATLAVRNWIAKIYEDKVLPTEIPKTAVASVAAAEFGTVYDISKYDGSAKTYKRAVDAYDAFALVVESMIQQSWAKQLAFK